MAVKERVHRKPKSKRPKSRQKPLKTKTVKYHSDTEASKEELNMDILGRSPDSSISIFLFGWSSKSKSSFEQKTLVVSDVVYLEMYP